MDLALAYNPSYLIRKEWLAKIHGNHMPISVHFATFIPFIIMTGTYLKTGETFMNK